ncbi:tetratricopeptide repeat protein [Cognatiluteimonas telluris]|uniref:tetratricopeptide repeat protein n=1 Tax=Cognatiluteimonas telluris TaxID=1104775 RepID=UPI00140E49E7
MHSCSCLPRARCRAALLVLLVASVLPSFAGATSRAPGDALAATMAGEFALQAGKLDDAARWYLDAARQSSDDAGLAERATRIALLAGDGKRAAEALALWRARAPGALPMRAAEASLSLRRNDAGAAVRQLELLLRDRGDGWRYALSALGGGAKDPRVTAHVLARLVDDKAIPGVLQAWLAFGGLAQKLDQDGLAARIVDEVVARFPSEPRVALLRASQLREAGKFDQARQVLDGLAPQTRSDQDMRLAVAAEYDALGDPEAAAAVVALGPQDNDSYSLRASLLAKAEDKAALQALYTQLQGDSSRPDPQRRLLLGQTAEFLKHMDEALAWYRSVPGGPQRWQARLRAANVLHELKRDREAFADLRALQADADADQDARRDAYLLEADLRQKDDAAAGEMDAFARGLAAFPDDSALLYARSLAWERRDDIPRAEADLRKVLVAEPDNVAALNALGYTLADRTTRYAEALQLIDRARVADPGNPAIIDSYGWVLYRLGRTDEALTQLRRAFMLQKDPEIGAHLGEVLWVTGDHAQARKVLDEARKLDPDNRSLQRVLAKLKV